MVQVHRSSLFCAMTSFVFYFSIVIFVKICRMREFKKRLDGYDDGVVGKCLIREIHFILELSDCHDAANNVYLYEGG